MICLEKKNSTDVSSSQGSSSSSSPNAFVTREELEDQLSKLRAELSKGHSTKQRK